ncbi:MAG: hypothetical protein COX62_01365 [Deltaproteobacteria bacterium CG_4_10_14_0_2_um_filter_43_8]|nr:MAG: hypothetical protein COV43_08415 [Deltaproteobacteria bacterium CG11_big_fil_rev_8_21_14_0_20_42_23]PJA21823.1 MAG: hypothetical protein COX62_01365 [Deltaproteobacteria bacterium CG_4_10_14_0_2_um_filter_43_8]PJC63697.1 MAG: hypothetical protein CO021_08165 [Deltaproteobacteria bacterium CG_4_9_14_0_2_um_filter_42_21]
MQEFSWSVLLGGIAFFFYGLKSARSGLQVVAGNRMRRILQGVTNNRLLALFFGIIVTIIFQSSGATSVLLISFVETQLITFINAIAVLLGADIGTTLTVFLLSLGKITEYSLLVVALGFSCQLSSKPKVKSTGAIILGFGLIFYGMHLMSEAAEPLKHSELARIIFTYLSTHPLATIVIATLFAGAIHSAGMIGIAIALSFAGVISLSTAVPIVLGANIGTCVTAILSAVGSNEDGKRVALAHTGSKIIGVALVYPFMNELSIFVQQISFRITDYFPLLTPGVAGEIVIVHVLFNIALAICFLPFTVLLGKLVTLLIPDRKDKAEPFGPKYLDKASLEMPSLAFAQVKREILRIAALVEDQINRCLHMFYYKRDIEFEITLIETEDDKIDILEKEVRFYLAKIATEHLSEEESGRQLALLAIGQDFEEIGDIISREMVTLARKKDAKGVPFSEQGWVDLRKMQEHVRANFALAISYLAQPSQEIKAQVLRNEQHIDEVEQRFRQSHLNRLHQGLKESFETSSLHLDILSNLRRMNRKITDIVVNAEKLVER